MRRREENVQGLPQPVQEQVVALEGLDAELRTLQARFRQERRDLERRYERLYEPIFAQRAALVNGRAGPLDGQDAGREQSQSGRIVKAGVPEFWLQAMRGSVAIAPNVTARDEAALRSLVDISCTTLPEARPEASTGETTDGGLTGCLTGFQLVFTFGRNDFFTDETLVKTYHLSDDDAEKIVLDKVIGTEINWKPGKDLTVKYVSKPVGDTKCEVKPRLSFFQFFRTPAYARLPEELSTIEADYHMGLAFKDKIIPHAVRWFTREAEDEDEFEDSDPDDAPDDESDEEIAVDGG